MLFKESGLTDEEYKALFEEQFDEKIKNMSDEDFDLVDDHFCYFDSARSSYFLYRELVYYETCLHTLSEVWYGIKNADGEQRNKEQEKEKWLRLCSLLRDYQQAVTELGLTLSEQFNDAINR